MSLLFCPHDGGLVLPDELKEPMPLADVLRGTTFISAHGRMYRLFGNEEDAFSVPPIPPIPSVLAPPKKSVLSLEEALQQIESFSSPIANEKCGHSKPIQSVQTVERVCLTADSPTLQLFQALSESAAPRLLRRDCPPQNVFFPAKEILHEVSQNLPVPASKRSPKPRETNEEHQRTLRIISDRVEEPFIVPFAKPETPSEESRTETITLKIVAEAITPMPLPKIVRKYRNRQGKTLYQRRSSLPAPVSSMDELPVGNELAPAAETRAFRWSEQSDSLMQTADNQIRMLADHLVVQSNQGTKAICFKSVFPGDGCSTILLCAVRALMKRNYRILLIDAHHRHIDLPKQLNLSGDLDTESKVMRLDDCLGLWVWQESKTAEENRIALAKTLSAHRDEYDLILLDNGSVTEGPMTELIEFWNQIELDGIILVSNTKRPVEMPVSHIAGRLRQHHIHLIGITENYV